MNRRRFKSFGLLDVTVMLFTIAILLIVSYFVYGCAPAHVTYFTVPLMRGQGAQVSVGRIVTQKFFVFKSDEGETSITEACTPSMIPAPSLPGIP